MAYSAKWNTTDISDEVVGVSDIPLLQTNHENALEVPTCTVTVIDGSYAYEVGDDISILKDGVVIWRAVIESIDRDIEGNTLTLNLIDAINKMRGFYAVQLTNADYQNAIVWAEDYDGRPLRFYAGSTSTPHRNQFLTLTHLLKTCLVKAGIVDPEDCNLADFYGEKASGFLYYDGSDKADVYYEDMAYHPQQIKYAMLNTATDPLWQGATLLDLFLYSLQVLGGVYRYSGPTIILERRNNGITTPSDDDIFSVKVSGFTNKFDCVTCKVTYLETTNVSGFNSYVAGALLNADYLTDESNAYPDPAALTHKIVSRDINIMRHAIVHRRKDNGTMYGMEELHYNAWASPAPNDYLFTYQYAKALYFRYPSVSETKTIVTSDDLSVRTARLPIRKHLNSVESTLRLEY